MKLLRWLRAVATCAALAAAWAASAQDAAPAAAPNKVLRVSFPIAETGFDPTQVNDLYSRTVLAHIFEAPLHYDHLARPVRIRPLTAEAMPQVSADFKVWTLKIRPGIYFADDPAFNGRKRELTAADYIYSWKRFADPMVNSSNWPVVETQGISGLLQARRAAEAAKKALDYDADIPGLRALDRYTLQIRLDQPRPAFIEFLAEGSLFGALAREVVERYGAETTAHPVGTGPYTLKQWRRSSFMALERNAGYRERFYSAEPAAGDAEGQALLQRFKGRRVPMVDRVEVSIIAEDQPRWLSFMNHQLDWLALPGTYVSQAMPGGKVAPGLARQGVQGYRVIRPDSVFTYFNMEDPLVGGYTPDKVALRRAIALGVNLPRVINGLYRGQAVPAQSPFAPHTTGYDPAFKSEMSDYDPARANALLDLYGYVDKDGDGWRDQPDGRPLVLELATQPDQLSRQFDEQWKKDMAALKLRIRFFPGQWPEQLKQSKAGKLMMWQLGNSATALDGQENIALYWSTEIGGQNYARFKMAVMDSLYERMGLLADGPEREALFLQAKHLAVAYMPYKHMVHRIANDVAHPWLIGFRRPMFWTEWWHMVDIEPGMMPLK